MTSDIFRLANCTYYALFVGCMPGIAFSWTDVTRIAWFVRKDPFGPVEVLGMHEGEVLMFGICSETGTMRDMNDHPINLTIPNEVIEKTRFFLKQSTDAIPYRGR